ncbi:YigZ family protein [Roseibium limicola]|uniref:YigZ family protein n=1 Tax=Roseibium limicola TaxID=2816037 RepID=A0A939J6T2_9HYPH|nr:YigZ family protein [Roseibium limicola]MBO0345442.1 YigZ family protein [Roseibium limicola]
MPDYFTVEREFEGFLEDRKSRFYAFLMPLPDFGRRMEELRAEHRKANHLVNAFRKLHDDGRVEEIGKDDGEPSGTSGMPTLKVLQGPALVNVGVIVVRYFGGTKLGGGGLARAYSGAAADAIQKAELVAFERRAEAKVSATFSQTADLERQVGLAPVDIVDRVFDAGGVTLMLEGPEEALDALCRDWPSRH